MSSSKRIVVTGANKGIGFEIALALAKQGHRLALACRNAALGAAAADKIATACAATPAAAPPIVVGFDLLDAAATAAGAASVRAAMTNVDVVVHNAGFAFTVDAVEPFGEQAVKTVAANYTGTLAAHDAYAPLLADGARVVFVGSRAGMAGMLAPPLHAAMTGPKLTVPALSAHMTAFTEAAAQGQHQAAGWPNSAYGTSKIGVAALSRVLAADESLVRRGISFSTMCPGWCRTDMAGHDEPPRSAAEGAETAVYLATAPEVAGVSGKFFGECAPIDWAAGKGF